MNKFLERHALKYELQQIKNIVFRYLPRFLQNNSDPTTTELANFKKSLDRRVEKAKAGIRHTMVSFKKDHDSRAYVQYHQGDLVELGGRLLPFTHPAYLSAAQAPSPGLIVLGKLTFQAIEDLLAFIEAYFPDYFDPDSWVPASYLRIVYHEISASVAIVQSGLLKLHIDPNLLAIAMLPFNRFLADPEQDSSFRKIANLRRLNEELYYLSRQCTPASVDASLRTLLHTINFNLVEFVDYCTNYQERLLAASDGSDDEQLHILARFRKYLSRITPRSGCIFDTSRPALFNELSAWIDAGVDYIESTRQIRMTEHTEDPSNQWASFKVDINLTTDQLFYLVRVLLAIALVQRKNIKKLTRFFADFFRTNRTPEIANRNVRKKVYAVNEEIKKAVRAWLQRAIDFIDQDTEDSDPW